MLLAYRQSTNESEREKLFESIQELSRLTNFNGTARLATD
jgi:hypothetical protein